MSFYNIDTAKSYATEAALKKALVKYGLEGFQFLVVCNRQGRYTAVFGAASLAHDTHGDLTRAARHGFKTFS